MHGRAEVILEQKKITEALENIHKSCMDKKLDILASIQEMQKTKNVLKGSETLKLQSLVEAFYQHLSATSLKEIHNLEEPYQQKIQAMNLALQQKQIDLEKECYKLLASTKKQYVSALQNAAVRMRQFFIQKNIKFWPKKFKQFSDEFGAICTINQSLSPYELDLERGTPKAFGHLVSDTNTYIPQLERLDFTNTSLKSLIELTNRILDECDFYDDTKALDFIEAELQKKRFSFVKMVRGGIVISHLKKIVLVEDDKDLIGKLRQQAVLLLSQVKQKFDVELRQKTLAFIQKAKNIENIAAASLIHLKNIMDELFQFSFLYQSTYEKFLLSTEKMRELDKMFTGIFQDAKFMSEEKKLSLPNKTHQLLNDIKKTSDECALSFREMETLKNKMAHYLSLFNGVFPGHMIDNLQATFSKEFQKFEAFIVEKRDRDQQWVTMNTLHSQLSSSLAFASDSMKLLNEASFLHTLEGRIYQNLQALENKSSLISKQENKIESVENDLQLMRDKFALIHKYKVSIDEKFHAIKQHCSQKSIEIYEPIQELMTMVNHQFAFAASFAADDASLARRLQVTLDQFNSEKAILQKKADEASYVMQLKEFVEESVLKNLHLWRPNCFGGVKFPYQNKNYYVANGIAEIFYINKQLNDPQQWKIQLAKIVQERCKMMRHWKYSFFHVRKPERNDFYHALQMHLDAKDESLDNLKSALKKISRFRC